MSRKIYYNLELEGAHDSFAFEVDDAQYNQIVDNLKREDVDLDQALETAIAMLSANVRMHDESLTQDVLDAQMVATATIWFLFNEAADEDDRVEGDVLLVEQDGELFITEVEIQEAEEPEEY
jgi:GTP cyclohydrolase II